MQEEYRIPPDSGTTLKCDTLLKVQNQIIVN
jgi:hypothetical protein